jgi:hypothetical protein
VVSEASRSAFFFKPAKRRCLGECKAGRLAYGRRAKRDSLLTHVLVLLLALLPAFADPQPGAFKMPASLPVAFVTINHLGESEQQSALREKQLLSHSRAIDPFGFTIRGAFKGLPPVVEHPTATPGQANAAVEVAAVVNVPTLEKAVQELTIGAVSVGSHEILIKSRPIREGDLVVLESGGREFVVWVQSIGARGVLFCDTDLQKQILKPFGSGPKELPGDSAWGIPDIHHFLNKDSPQ